MDLPVRNFTVMSVMEDEKSQTWLLLRESQYYCEIETEKVVKAEMTDGEDERRDDYKISPDELKEEIWIGTRELVIRLEENKKNENNTIDWDNSFRVPYCV